MQGGRLSRCRDRHLSYELGRELVKQVGGWTIRTVVKPTTAKFSQQIAALTSLNKQKK